MAKKTATAEGGNKYNQRRWAIPSKRAKNYASERKAKVHQRGPNLQAQTDHAGLFKYKKALSEGKSKAEAREISQKKSK